MMKTASFSCLRHSSPWPTHTHKLCLLPWHTSLSASHMSTYWARGQRKGLQDLVGVLLTVFWIGLWTSLQGWLLILEGVNTWFSQSVMVTRNLFFSSTLLALPLPWLLMEGEWHLTCSCLPFPLLGHPGTHSSVCWLRLFHLTNITVQDGQQEFKQWLRQGLAFIVLS